MKREKRKIRRFWEWREELAIPEPMHRSWVTELRVPIWTNKSSACVRACVLGCVFWKVRVRRMFVRGISLRSSAFFRKWRKWPTTAGVRSYPLTNSLSTAHVVKTPALSLFFFPPPRRDLLDISRSPFREVVSRAQHEVSLIRRTYLNSCLWLVKTKLSSRVYASFRLSVQVFCWLCFFLYECIYTPV